jgi:hypothetical protein
MAGGSRSYPQVPDARECNHHVGGGKDCSRLQTARDRVYLIGRDCGANSDLGQAILRHCRFRRVPSGKAPKLIA